MIVIAINGYPNSGKDTLVKFISEKTPVFSFSNVTHVKKCASKIGWDGEKDIAGRRLLSQLEDALMQYDYSPVSSVWDAIKDVSSSKETEQALCFIHCRKPKYIDFHKHYFQNKVHLPFKSLLVRNSQKENSIWNNTADSTDIFNYNYDFVLYNDGCLEDFRITCHHFYSEQILTLQK